MTITIALAGKGGTGKTTVAALMIRSLVDKVDGPILAIDADPAANLHMALGMPMPSTVGEIREKMTAMSTSGELGITMTRQDYLDLEVRMALEEGKEIDLIAMGRPEGPGCYCAFNHMLRQIIDDMSQPYKYVIMDNEAGMEHISRRTTRDVDFLLLITDPTLRGVHTAADMAKLSETLDVNVKKTLLIVNRVSGEIPEPLQKAIDELEIEVAAYIQADENVNRLDALGEPLASLDEDSPAFQAVEEMTARVLGSS
ncbi:MAG: AAA family ATPase [Anaerolineales bacterium]|jgi:CO dehydrogenase maturation factor